MGKGGLIEQWKEKLPLRPDGGDPPPGFPWSWLLRGKDNRLGCVACKAMTTKKSTAASKFATFAVEYRSSRWSHLCRHQALASHKRAVKKLLGGDDDADGNDGDDAPPAAQFKAVWDSICSGLAPSSNGATAGRKKVYKMVECLAEGMRMIDRAWIRRATSMALMRDERDSRLVVRFSMTTSDLECRRGVLGQARHFGSGAEAITEATGQIIRDFATSSVPGPDGPDELASHIRHIVHQLAIDAAADETLSGRMMQRGTRLDGERPLTPNLLLITRDKAHGSRRTPSCHLPLSCQSDT